METYLDVFGVLRISLLSPLRLRCYPYFLKKCLNLFLPGMLWVKFGWNWSYGCREDFKNFFSIFLLLSPLGKGFKIDSWFPLTKGALFVPFWVKLAHCIRRNRLKYEGCTEVIATLQPTTTMATDKSSLEPSAHAS